MKFIMIVIVALYGICVIAVCRFYDLMRWMYDGVKSLTNDRITRWTK
jgi:hypothetical protein